MTFDKRLKLRQIASIICFLAGIGMIFLSFRLEEQEGSLFTFLLLRRRWRNYRCVSRKFFPCPFPAAQS